MFDNQNYPWYAQKTGTLKTLYDGFFPIAVDMSPLGVGNAFDVDTLTGRALYSFGALYGLSARGQYFDGLVYDIDNWSGGKVWSGHMEDLESRIYKNFLKMKAYIAGRPYTLNLLKAAFDILTDGMGTVNIWIEEGLMNFVIHVDASQEVTRLFMELNSFDLRFLGKPVGVSYTWHYINVPSEDEGD